ncbi:MAG: hypothetical protein RQ745_13055, partial [Longimicrobiales bacterium]|nr:hypothetical protein [Longimicrobiales bacterium]
MPSDPRIQEALDRLAAPRDAFRSAVATADEEIRAARQQAEGSRDPAEALGRELGEFARDRVDPARLAGLLQVAEATDPLIHHLMESAHDLFATLTTERGGFHITVPAGGDLRDTVRDALAGLGRAFGVAHAVEKARAHRYDPDTDHLLLQRYPFHRWSMGERRLAPPLVVTVRGEDLRPGGLTEFLDGAVRIALVVEGPTAPAPLARLVGHGVFVAQTTDPEVIGALASHDGPGVVAWVEEGAGAVEFVHAPAAGDRPWRRMKVVGGVEALHARLEEFRRPGRSAPHATDLRHLLELATPPAEEAVATGSTVSPAAEATHPDDP